MNLEGRIIKLETEILHVKELIDDIKNNDLVHLQKNINDVNKSIRGLYFTVVGSAICLILVRIGVKIVFKI